MYENIKKKIDTWKWRIVRVEETLITFSEKSGVSLSTLSLSINGKRNPTLDTFEKIEGTLIKLEEEKGIE